MVITIETWSTISESKIVSVGTVSAQHTDTTDKYNSTFFPSLNRTKTVFPSHLFKFPGICNSGACLNEVELQDPLCSSSPVLMIVFD
ncbi:unnamed protein product [Sphenostylis stenocarpa]|uniref:Uncharacterized protein n=1 Tax=Sphenostylis stenocarpa TaxID=92480 RepID=A0AA86W123_9FABA|nr:unnamed protein product [Sphenostylis stenocarpa]